MPRWVLSFDDAPQGLFWFPPPPFTADQLRQPTQALHLCPIDLRKLSHRYRTLDSSLTRLDQLAPNHHSIGFDIGERYRQLATYYAREGWREEAGWMARRIKHLPTPPTTSAPPARGQEAEEEEEKGAAATDP